MLRRTAWLTTIAAAVVVGAAATTYSVYAQADADASAPPRVMQQTSPGPEWCGHDADDRQAMQDYMEELFGPDWFQRMHGPNGAHGPGGAGGMGGMHGAGSMGGMGGMFGWAHGAQR